MWRLSVRHLVVLTVLCWGASRAKKTGNSSTSRRMNVLMLIADDMRPEIGAFYDPVRPYSMYSRIKTPSLNGLAATSLVLRRAYVQQAICAPSRVSFLTSRRPDTTLVYTIEDTYWRNVAGNLTTIPQFFKQNGYRSIGIGKVFHHGSGSDQDDPPSWTEDHYRPSKQSKEHWFDRANSWQAVSPMDRAANPLPDDQVANYAVNRIRQLGADQDRPFFMAVGFYKPHLPFVFPKQYMALYPLKNIDLPRPATANLEASGVQTLARTRWEINKYRDISSLNMTSSSNDSTPISPLPDDVSRHLRRAYYSSVSYVDGLIGAILRELASQKLADNTIVAFLGDHGWHLGESNLWGKHTNFELSTRAPMIIRVPGLTDNGLVFDRPVEFVDLFPTLVEAAGFDSLPVCPADTEQSWRISLCTEGASLMPLIRRRTAFISSGGPPSSTARQGTEAAGDPPSLTSWQGTEAPGGPPSLAARHGTKAVAFSQYPRRGFSVMGYSVRTDRYRYTEWTQRRPPHKRSSRWRVVHGVELYDHVNDPDETTNVADSPSYSVQRASLEVLLAGGWRGAMFHNETVSIAPTSRRQKASSGTGRVVARLRLVTLRPAAAKRSEK